MNQLQMNFLQNFLCLTVCLLKLCKFSVADIFERRLYELLLENYNPLERPVNDSKRPVAVYMKFNLQQLVDVDERNQMIQTNVYLQFNWTDYRLVWDPREYGGVEDLRFPYDKIWRPDVLLYNSVDSNFDSTYKSNVVVYSHGVVTWLPPGILKSSCNIDIAWFPFDDQLCFLKFGSWTYNGGKLNLLPESNASLDTSEMVENGEWLLIDTPVIRTEQFYACCPEPFIDLKFFLHLRRRTLYYAVNMIIPSMLILLMTILGFALPVESGEKVTLEITILLSMCVFMNMVTQVIPSTSEAVPVIVVFFTCNMIIVSASVIFNVVILGLHYRTPDTHKMSNWTKVLLLDWLPWLLCMKRPGHQFSRSSFPEFVKEKFWPSAKNRSQTEIRSDSAPYTPVSDRKFPFCEECDAQAEFSEQKSEEIWKINRNQSIISSDQLIIDQNQSVIGRNDSNMKNMLTSLTKIHESLRFITRRLERDEEEEDAKNDWKLACVKRGVYKLWRRICSYGG